MSAPDFVVRSVLSHLPDRLPDPPHAWQAALSGYTWLRQFAGCSAAMVFRLEAPGRPTLFVKTEPSGKFSELPGETARLQWLQSIGVPCAAVQSFVQEAERDWLLISAVPGQDLSVGGDHAPDLIVALVAEALRTLHQVDVTRCPFDHRLDHRLVAARTRMEAGLIDQTDFDDERLGRSAEDLFAEMLGRRPSSEDLVVTHGDACLPNLLAHGDRFSGFIDCGRLGVADRWQDLALACRSIEHNLGKTWVERFLAHYGVEMDPERLAFYQLLDEFF